MSNLGHDGAVITGGPGNASTAANLKDQVEVILLRLCKNTASVTNLVLKIAHNGSLGHLANRKHVADSELRLLAAINKLASVHALSGNEQLLLETVLVHVPELNDSEGRTTARIMDDLLDHTLHITVALGKVESAKTSRALPVLRVRLEHRSSTPTTRTDDTTLQT